MKSKPESERRDRQDWVIVLIILLIGFLCVTVAGQWAIRPAASWQLDTNMESNIDPNGEVQVNKPMDFIEPLDPDIQTPPAWAGVLFTPGAASSLTPRTPLSQPENANTQPASTEPATAVTSATVLAATNTGVVTNTAVPTNTLIWFPPPAATNTKKPHQPPTDIPSNTPIPVIDLEINMSDSGSYAAGASHDYIITVYNNSTSAATNATITDAFGAQVTGVSWTCLPVSICHNGGGNPFTDTIDLPAGASVTYTVSATVSGASAGTMWNTATVTSVYETDPGDNTVTISTAGPDAGGGVVTVGIGDGSNPYLNLGSGNSIIMILSPGIAHSFVFYERYSDPPANTQIALDMVQIEISDDGSTWHTVFFWGDGNSGNNGSLGGGYCPGTEDDNCTIPSTALVNGTGITIDIDSLGYTGTYPWVQITCPGGDSGDGCDIDAIQP